MNELVSDGNNLFIKQGTKTIARFSTEWDRFLVYKDLNGSQPYLYFNQNGESGMWDGGSSSRLNVTGVNIGEFSILYGDPWLYFGRKSDPTSQWRLVVNKDAGPETVKSAAGIALENDWSLTTDGHGMVIKKGYPANAINKPYFKFTNDGNIGMTRNSAPYWIAEGLGKFQLQ